APTHLQSSAVTASQGCSYSRRCWWWEAQASLFGRKQFLSAAEVDRDKAADAPFDHRNPEQAVHSRHRHRIVGDDQIAGVGLAAHSVEEVAETLDIRIVEWRIHLVEDTDRRGVGKEKAEDQCHRGQRLFAA